MELSRNQIKEILNYTSYNPDDYQDWINVGMILKDSLNESGFEIWDDWSKRSSKYDQSVMGLKWGSFKGTNASGNQLTLGSLIAQAQKNGYKFRKDDYFQTGSSGVKDKKNPTHKKPEKSQISNIYNTTENGFKGNDIRISEALKEESGTFSELFKRAQDKLFKSETALNYYYDRGITVKTMRHYGDGWVENYGPYNLTGPLLAGTPEGYAVRNVNYEKNLKTIESLPPEKQKNAKKGNLKYFKPSSKQKALDIPQGLEFVIKQPDLRNPNTGYKVPIFIFEGYFDVRSLYEATGIDGISLNGIGNIQIVIDQLKEFKVNRPIVLALDNDSTGEDKNQKRYKDLKKAGFTVYWNQNFYGKYKDANELLVNDRDKLIQSVEESENFFYQDFEESLNKNQLEKFKSHVRNSIDQPEYPTGFKTLDSSEFLNGGLHPGLYGIGAVSSLGKTSFILQIADNLAENRIPVLYYSLEMSKFELMAKSISRTTYINSYDSYLKKSTNAFDTLQILDAKKQWELTDYELNFIDECTDEYFRKTGDNLRIIEGIEDITVEDIYQEIEKQVVVTGKAPVVFIDYLQLIAPPREITHVMTDKQIIDYNIHQLKKISRAFNIPVVCISSYNRSSYEKEGEFQSFLGSNGIEYSADVLISLERNVTLTQKQLENDNKETFFFKQNIKNAIKKERETNQKWLKLVILKNRICKSRGEIGFCFNSKYNHFYDYGEIYPETGTTEKLEEQNKRYNEILKGKTTILQSPDPKEVFRKV